MTATALTVPRLERRPARTADRAATAGAAAPATLMAIAITLAAVVPFVAVLAKPVAGLIMVRGTAYADDWGRAITVMLLFVAPAAYAMFFGTAGELLKTRVAESVHRATMRVAAVGVLPYIVLTAAAVAWSDGPQEALFVAAGLAVPLSMLATTVAAKVFDTPS